MTLSKNSCAALTICLSPWGIKEGSKQLLKFSLQALLSYSQSITCSGDKACNQKDNKCHANLEICRNIKLLFHQKIRKRILKVYICSVVDRVAHCHWRQNNGGKEGDECLVNFFSKHWSHIYLDGDVRPSKWKQQGQAEHRIHSQLLVFKFLVIILDFFYMHSWT